MSRKKIVMISMVVGSFTGGWIASKLGFSGLSMEGLIGSSIGGILGIWAGFKLTD